MEETVLIVHPIPTTPETGHPPRPRRGGLGIGVITYNRRAALEGTLAAIARHTAVPHTVVVADDGSTDYSADWAREQGWPVMTGPNGGAGPNKNRALLYLMTVTECDPILLVEDDFRPCAAGWERPWIEAAALWHHVNVLLPAWGELPPELAAGHTGTPDDPIWGHTFTGQCTVTSRAVLERTGYLEPLFRGFGEEHVEWTRRIGRLLNWPSVDTSADGRVPQVPQIYTGGLMEQVSAGTFFDADQTRINRDIHRLVASGPVYRPPYRSVAERQHLVMSLAECLADAQYYVP